MPKAAAPKLPVVGPTVEEIIAARATHTCPKHGGAFHPSQCKVRRARSESGKSFYLGADTIHLDDCAVCDGPVPIEAHEETAMSAIPEPVFACPDCGEGHAGRVLKSGNRSSICQACWDKRVAAEEQKAKPKKEKSVAVQAVAAPKPVPNEHADFLHHCELHGPHNGSSVAGTPNTECPECLKIKQKGNQRRAMESRIILDLQHHGWLLAWITAQAEKSSSTPQTYILKQLAETVPADDIKRHLVGSLGLNA